MERNLNEITGRSHDLVIVGGGIFGACAAWDAVLRGLSVALIERHDFSGAASANSFKMAHGGIRYLQHADIVRVRESCHERSALLRVAPHLVKPLPIAIPTYGHGLKGKELLRAGMLAYDLLTLDRNRGISDPRQHIPMGRFLSRRDTLDLFPNLESPDLTGAAVFCDGQIYNGPRLALSFLRSAVERGVLAANYVEATGLCLDRDRVTGVTARDLMTGEELEIRGRTVLNATGGWAGRFLQQALPERSLAPVPYSRDACFIVPRRLSDYMGVALSGATKDPDAVISRSARHLFVVPWRDVSLVGVWHVVWRDHPDAVTVTDQELESFIEEVNGACPGLDLELSEVRAWNAGLVPFGDNEEGARNLRYGHRSHIVDHGKEHGVAGLLSLIGVRYTMARGHAAQAVDLVVAGQGRRAPRVPTDKMPVHGGDFASFDDLEAGAMRRGPVALESRVLRALLHNHGTAHDRVLDLARDEPSLGRALPNSTVLGAEVVHAVRDEMALMLDDVVFRRTDLASDGDPGEDALRACAGLMARERGWGADEADQQLERVRAKLFRPAGGDPSRSRRGEGPRTLEPGLAEGLEATP